MEIINEISHARANPFKVTDVVRRSKEYVLVGKRKTYAERNRPLRHFELLGAKVLDLAPFAGSIPEDTAWKRRKTANFLGR